MACDRNATEPEKSLPQTVSVWQCDSRRGPDRELTALCRRLGSLHCLVGRISEVEQPEQHVTVLLRQRYVLGFVSADQHGESSEDPVQLEAVALPTLSTTSCSISLSLMLALPKTIVGLMKRSQSVKESR